MNTDPIAFFREDFVALFNQGVAALKARADEGDAAAAAGYEDVAGARGAVQLRFEGDGGGTVWLAVDGGHMEAREAPGDLPIRMGVAAPADAAKAALEEIHDHELLDAEAAPKRIARAASAQVEKVLAGHVLEFHLTLADLPSEPEEVTLRIAIGAGEPPEQPKFTARVSWDDIEDVRDGELTPQQLFGRLKLTGDATQAMALGMTLMQQRNAAG
jgi:hypothetical protein